MRPPKTLGERIRYLRLKRGMHQNELAKRLGVCKTAVSQWESNQTGPRPEHFKKIQDYLVKTRDNGSNIKERPLRPLLRIGNKRKQIVVFRKALVSNWPKLQP
ncbi:helix-turn-helix domain-containing protein [Elusimicrobiota bacterium]